MFSIFHRVSGIVLASFVLAQPIFIRTFFFHTSNYAYYEGLVTLFMDFFWVVAGVLFVVLLAFHYHLSNGVRHLIWDMNANTQLNITQVVDSTRYILIVAFLLLGINFARGVL